MLVVVVLHGLNRASSLGIGIGWITDYSGKPMIPGGGCGRFAQLSKIEPEIHTVSQVLEVAGSTEDLCLPLAAVLRNARIS
jgi:hypothetical protein